MKINATITAAEAATMLRAMVAAKLGVLPEDVGSMEITTYDKARICFTDDGFLDLEHELHHRI